LKRKKGAAVFRVLRLEDWVGVALGAWLMASPVALGFSDSNGATVNAFAFGLALILLELMEFEEHEPAKDWIDLFAGLWLVVSPVALDFVSRPLASQSTVAVGLLTVLSAAWALSPLDRLIGGWWHSTRHHTGTK